MVAKGSPGDAQFVPGWQGNILLLSMRRLRDLVAFCVPYEFEDAFAEVTGADGVDAGYREGNGVLPPRVQAGSPRDRLSAVRESDLPRLLQSSGSRGVTSSSSRSSTTHTSCTLPRHASGLASA